MRWRRREGLFLLMLWVSEKGGYWYRTWTGELKVHLLPLLARFPTGMNEKTQNEILARSQQGSPQGLSLGLR